MFELFITVFGEGNELTILQMSARACVTFLFALILIRIAGRRSFGMNSTFDNVLAFLLGAILSRSITGASPYLPTLIACLVLAILHRLFGLLAVHYRSFGKITKGKIIPLYLDGKFIRKNLFRSLVSEADVMEQVRMSMNSNDLNDVQEIYMERNGKISIIKKRTSHES